MEPEDSPDVVVVLVDCSEDVVDFTVVCWFVLAEVWPLLLECGAQPPWAVSDMSVSVHVTPPAFTAATQPANPGDDVPII